MKFICSFLFSSQMCLNKKMWIGTPYFLEVIRFQINWRKRRKITVCGVRFWKPAVSTKWGKPVDLPVKNDAQGVSTTPEMNVWDISHTMKPTKCTKKYMIILCLLWIVRMSFVREFVWVLVDGVEEPALLETSTWPEHAHVAWRGFFGDVKHFVVNVLPGFYVS